MGKTVTVGVKLHPDIRHEISRQIRCEMDARRDEIEEEVTRVPLTTLADLLDLDQSESTPTWDAIFEAVDELMDVRRG